MPKATLADVRRAFAWAHQYRARLTRYERSQILLRAADGVRRPTEEIADLITAESGLCKKDSLYEAGRVADVMTFGANEALKDDGQVFSCDLTPHGKKRRVYTQRDPLLGVISAITPFNHPMNQVAHKVVPSIATNNRIVVKPSEKVPLSTYLLADILYAAGLPQEMLQVITGDPKDIADELITNEHVDLITFTGGVQIGKSIASKMGYRRAVLEPGGNDPIMVMEDADLEEVSTLAVSGSYKNSRPALYAGQANALVHETVADRFVELLVEKTRAIRYGDPADPATDMGTVIDEAAAKFFEAQVNDAVSRGATLLLGNRREGALYSPTVLDHVSPDMPLVKYETFGPVSPVIRFRDIDDAIRISNSTDYGLSSSVCTNRLDYITRFIAELQVGQRERARSAGLPARTHAVRRHQGFGSWLQGRRPGSDEKLHQCEDLFAAVGLSSALRHSRSIVMVNFRDKLYRLSFITY